MQLRLGKKGEILPIASSQIAHAVEAFIKDGGLVPGTDRNGFKLRTARAITAATVLNQGGDFWYVRENGILLAYCLSEFGRDQAGHPAYLFNQAWLSPDIRNKGLLRKWFYEICDYARYHGANKIVLLSSHNPLAYCRLLGLKKRKFMTLIEEEI